MDGLEVSLRSFIATLERARPVLEALQRDHAEAIANLYSELESFDPEGALNAVVTIKALIERGRAT